MSLLVVWLMQACGWLLQVNTLASQEMWHLEGDC